jgi:O-antigen/teichoic acid export membrane protein
VTSAEPPVEAAAPPKPWSALPQRFLRSAASNYASSFASLILAFFVTPLLVRGLGKDAYGTWTLVTSSVLYYSVLQFGLARAAVKFVAEANAVGDLGAVRRTISTSFLALSAPAILLIAASPGIAYLFPRIFHIPDGYRTAAEVLVVLSTIDFAVGIPCDTFGATLVGLQRFDFLAAASTGTAVAQALSWVVILAFGGGLVPIGAATVSFSLISNVVRYSMIKRLLGGSPLGLHSFERRLIRPLVSMSSWIALGEFVEIIVLRLDPVVVALIANVPQVGVYGVGQKLAGFVESFAGPAMAMFFPYASHLSASGDEDEIRRTLMAGTRLSLGLAAPLAIVISVLATPAVHDWVGSGFGGAGMVVVYLALTQLVFAFPRVGINILRGLGDVGFVARVSVFEGAINLGASIFLGRRIGIQGVALGTLVGVVVNHFFVLLPYVCRKLGVSLWALVATILRAHLPPAGLTVAVGFALRSFAAGGIPQLFAAGAATGLTYLGTFALTGLSRSERRTIRELVAARLPGRGTTA